MKKLLVMLMALMLVPFCFAQENLIATAEPSGGAISADSPLYGLDIMADDISISLTTDPEARVEKELKVADERAAEYKDMKMKMKEKEAEKAMMAHDKLMNQVDAEEAKLTTEEKRAHVFAMISKHQTVLENVKARLIQDKGEAPAGLDNAITNAKDLQTRFQAKQGETATDAQKAGVKCQSWEKEDRGRCVIA